MRVKSILSLIVFLATFIFSVALVGLPQNNFYLKLNDTNRNMTISRKIADFLEQDKRNGYTRDQVYFDSIDDSTPAERLAIYAQQTELYVEDMRSLDDSGMPVEFQVAWHAHLNAWQKHSDFLNEAESADAIPYYQNSDNAFNLDKKSVKIYDAQSDEINQTWYNVLRVGRKYGAYVSVE